MLDADDDVAFTQEAAVVSAPVTTAAKRRGKAFASSCRLCVVPATLATV